jgi:hypothetical protein
MEFVISDHHAVMLIKKTKQFKFNCMIMLAQFSTLLLKTMKLLFQVGKLDNQITAATFQSFKTHMETKRLGLLEIYI